MTGPAAAVGSPGAHPRDSRWRALRSGVSGLLLAAVLLAADLAAPMLGTGIQVSAATSPVSATHPLSATRPVSAASPAQAGPCVAGWRELPIPDESFISTPFEVLTRDGKPAWILGGANSGILALRWNGSTWKQAAARTSGHRGLVGGASLADGTVLGVGYYRRLAGEGDGSLEPIGGLISGSTWKSHDIPDAPGPRAMLSDVAALAGGGAWAVGARLQDGRLRVLAARWSGSRWTRKEPASPAAASGLLAIEGTTSGTLWAVGWQEAGLGQLRPWIVRRSGNGWQSVKPPALPRGSAVLTDVAFRSGRDGWAVGYLAAKGSDRHTAILARWDGQRWTRQSLPWADETAALPRSVTVGSGSHLWIAGTQPANEQREARGFIAHWDGGSWDMDVLGVPGAVRSEVMDIAATKWGAVAAASVAASLLVLTSCDESQTLAATAHDGSRIRVSHMKARRRARPADWNTRSPDGEAFSTASLAAASAGRDARRLPAPVKATGFTVQDRAAEAGLAQTTLTYGGFAADFDDNGYRDVFYSRHGGLSPRLAMNGAAGFSDAPTDAFSPIDRHGCDSADVDRDGSRDILCAVGAQRGKAIRRHELSLAPDKPERRLATATNGISDPLGRGRDVAFLRLDGDAYPEVFISNAPDREDGLPGYNRFYRNAGGTFVPAPGVGLDSSHGALCLEASDFDQDGDEDLAYCTAYGFSGRPAGLRLMRNEGGRLADRTATSGVKPFGDVDVAFADVSGDGRRDLIQLAPDLVRVSQRMKGGYQRIFEARTSAAMALAAADASGDGIADLYIVRGDDEHNLRDLLLVSTKRGRSFIPVRIPHTAEGSADDVIALDYDRNGLSDFVVLNGRQKDGPVQLLAAFPS